MEATTAQPTTFATMPVPWCWDCGECDATGDSPAWETAGVAARIHGDETGHTTMNVYDPSVPADED
jgi:hypothetical protein